MTLTQKTRALEKALFDAINASGLPLCVCELQTKVLLSAIQNTLRQEEEKEAAAEAAKRAEEAKTASASSRPDAACGDEKAPAGDTAAGKAGEPDA